MSIRGDKAVGDLPQTARKLRAARSQLRQLEAQQRQEILFARRWGWLTFKQIADLAKLDTEVVQSVCDDAFGPGHDFRPKPKPPRYRGQEEPRRPRGRPRKDGLVPGSVEARRANRRVAREREKRMAVRAARRLHSLDEACELLGGISRATLYRLRKQGAINFVKAHGASFMTDAEVRRYVASLR
jgi:hypothetical protein